MRIDVRVAVLAVTCAVAPAHAGAVRTSGSALPPVQATLAINDLAMGVVDNGMFAFRFYPLSEGDLEYPRGSGRIVAFAGGFWVSGRVSGETRMVISEFGSEWAPGPLAWITSPPVTWPGSLFRYSRADTAGRGAWAARAVPLGAPAAPPADETLWAVCNDYGTAAFYPHGNRMTNPIGLEAHFTTYAFDRPGTLRRAAFVKLTLLQMGAAPLDSAAIGVFFDPRVGLPALRAAYDLAREMGYSYAADPPTGGEAIAVGVVWLGGPRPPLLIQRMRPTSYVVYANGADPAVPHDYDDVTRGLEPWGAAMIDSSTMQPTPFFSSGDPVAGTGWNASVPPHPHTVLSAQPFTFAPGDTQTVDVAIVVGHGPDSVAAILDLRAAADAARAAFATGFANLPAADPYPAPGRILAYPNPAPAGARIAFRIEAPAAPAALIIYDVCGRRVRRMDVSHAAAGRYVAEWDGRDEHGHRARAGLYFARFESAGAAATGRLVLLSGN